MSRWPTHVALPEQDPNAAANEIGDPAFGEDQRNLANDDDDDEEADCGVDVGKEVLASVDESVVVGLEGVEAAVKAAPAEAEEMHVRFTLPKDVV